MSPEIHIYLQRVKSFLLSNEEAYNYFLRGLDDKIFFNEVETISEKNFNDSGNPTLTKEQFEELKNKLKSSKEDEKLFFNFGDFGHISLN